MTFYIVMTVCVGALFIWIWNIAMNWSPSDDEDFDTSRWSGAQLRTAPLSRDGEGVLASKQAKILELAIIIDHPKPCPEHKHKVAVLDHQPNSGGL
jgi:hypothetical protein